MPTRTRILVSLALLVTLAGCAGTTTSPQPAPQQGEVLTARLVPGPSVELSWHDSGRAPAGEMVEYANSPTGPFTPLDFLPPERTSYAHRNLIPDTNFYYRVLPYYGPASNAVTVTLPPGAYDENATNADPWATPATLPGDPRAQSSIRDGDTSSAGAPTSLHATVEDANGVKLTWTDNASDATGYLVEVKPAGSADYQVVQLLAPKINSCGIVTLPDEKTATYRVRAFYYGAASNTASQYTD